MCLTPVRDPKLLFCRRMEERGEKREEERGEGGRREAVPSFKGVNKQIDRGHFNKYLYTIFAYP